VPVGTDDRIYKTAYTRELDVKKHMSAYSIILNLKNPTKNNNIIGIGGSVV